MRFAEQRAGWGKFLGARERHFDRLEAGVAHDLRGDFHRAGIVAGNRHAKLFAGSMRFACELARAG